MMYDYTAEYRGIQALRAAGIAEVELHGYTHIHPDGASWAVAQDRYEAQSWYRELGRAGEPAITARPAGEHPLALGVASLQRYFGVHPTTLIPPGDQWTNAILERALDLGLTLVSSYYLALRHGERFCWTTHVCAPYLDEPDAAWFDAGLPVVGYCHDREPALQGVDWFSRWLDRWQAAGARRLLDFRELAATVTRRLYYEEQDSTLYLTATGEQAPLLVRPPVVKLHLPSGRVPSRVLVSVDGRTVLVEAQVIGDRVGRVLL
jgi:hypothetical protein